MKKILVQLEKQFKSSIQVNNKITTIKLKLNKIETKIFESNIKGNILW